MGAPQRCACRKNAYPVFTALNKKIMSRFSKQIEIRNKKASFEYEWLDRYTAGLALRGTEIKSIREGKANIAQCYCYFLRGEAFVKGMNINPYEQGTHYNHEPLRERKLLLKNRNCENSKRVWKRRGCRSLPPVFTSMKRDLPNLTSPWPKEKNCTTNALPSKNETLNENWKEYEETNG